MDQANERHGFQPMGKVEGQGARVGDGEAREWRFAAEDGAEAHVALLAADIVRVRLSPKGATPAESWAVARTEWPAIAAEEHASVASGVVRLTTTEMAVEVATDPLRLAFRWHDGARFGEDDQKRGMGIVATLGAADLPDPAMTPGSLRCYKRLASGERILGAGERTEPLDKRGYRITFWNTDPPHAHNLATGPMYSSIPFWLTLRPDGRCWGLFMDSVGRSDLDAGASDPSLLSFGVVEGDLTYYVFAGPTPADVLRQYSELTGRMPMPPRWALGYGQSRWSYAPEEYLREIAQTLRARDIPCDHLWLDIDYMDGYRVFTWSPTRFPQPKQMLEELAAEGFKVVAIIDPGVKADPTDPTFAEGVERDHFVRMPDGTLFVGSVWPGASVFTDYSRADAREWWGERHRELLESGLAGIWVDMNEPGLTDMFTTGSATVSGGTLAHDALHHPHGPDGQALPHARFHNAYGMQMARATREGLERLRPNQRAFVLSRSGYAGIQRYAAMWTGDNSSIWEHLRLAVSMCLSVGVSGQPFIGFDSGGFFEASSGEMLVRFTQLGAFFPFFRNHSCLGTPGQEPWAFGQPFEAYTRAAIELRYQLLPYLYTLFEEAHSTGAPIARPMAYAYPEDSALAGIDDQFLLGMDLLAAPILRTGQFQRDIRFPAGVWRDWRSGERFIGPQTVRVDAPIDAAPLFVREGAIIPLGPVMRYIGELTEEPLTLVCALGPDDGAQAEGALYEDDGATRDNERGVWQRTRFTARRSGQRITVRAEQVEGVYQANRSGVTLELRLPRTQLAPTAPRPQLRAASLNGAHLYTGLVEREERRYETVLRVPLGRVTAPFAVELDLG